MTQTASTIKQRITEVQEQGKNLTNWEADFVDSIAEQFEERGSISDRQEEILERVHAEKTPL